MLFPDREKSLDHVFCGTLAVVYYLTTSLHFTTLLALRLNTLVNIHAHKSYFKLFILSYKFYDSTISTRISRTIMSFEPTFIFQY